MSHYIPRGEMPSFFIIRGGNQSGEIMSGFTTEFVSNYNFRLESWGEIMSWWECVGWDTVTVDFFPL